MGKRSKAGGCAYTGTKAQKFLLCSLLTGPHKSQVHTTITSFLSGKQKSISSLPGNPSHISDISSILSQTDKGCLPLLFSTGGQPWVDTGPCSVLLASTKTPVALAGVTSPRLVPSWAFPGNQDRSSFCLRSSQTYLESLWGVEACF